MNHSVTLTPVCVLSSGVSRTQNRVKTLNMTLSATTCVHIHWHPLRTHTHGFRMTKLIREFQSTSSTSILSSNNIIKCQQRTHIWIFDYKTSIYCNMNLITTNKTNYWATQFSFTVTVWMEGGACSGKTTECHHLPVPLNYKEMFVK